MSPPLLDKPVGSRRSPAQASRNQQAIKALMEGTLEPGELFSMVMGTTVQKTSTRSQPGMCLDCRKDVRHAGDPLKSQPRRCKPCGRDKRQEHYQAGRSD